MTTPIWFVVIMGVLTLQFALVFYRRSQKSKLIAGLQALPSDKKQAAIAAYTQYLRFIKLGALATPGFVLLMPLLTSFLFPAYVVHVSIICITMSVLPIESYYFRRQLLNALET